MSGSKTKSASITNVDLKKYWSSNQDTHDSVCKLVNSSDAKEVPWGKSIDGDMCTVLICTPKKLGGSFGSHPGHCGIVLWAKSNLKHQSFGMWTDEDSNGGFSDECINAKNGGMKKDNNFMIWYFTTAINKDTYNNMRSRISTLGSKEVPYGKVFVFRGFSEDGSYSCMTAVDTILCAGGLSHGIASVVSTPYAYAQTFTSWGWSISYADNAKNM